MTVLAPKGIQVSAKDQIEIEGDKYDVIGDVRDWTHGPFEFRPGCSISLKRVTGGR